MATKKAKVPTKADINSMRKFLRSAVKDAEKREDAARKRWDDAEAELSYLEDCMDEAENDVCDADDDLDRYNELIAEAEITGNWSYVVKFKPINW